MTAQFPVTDAAAEASLATIATNTPTVGQKASAASSPVVLASDQTLPLPAGAATAANQATANTSLAAIATAQGTGGTGISEPAGGAGLLGWLSGIYQALIGVITVSAKPATETDRSGSISGTVTAATVVAGGTGGTAGTQTVTGTTGTGTLFQASVTVAGGAITAVLGITVGGVYTVSPTNIAAEPVTGAGLTGATLSLTMAGVATQIAAANASRRKFEFQPTSVTSTDWALNKSGNGITAAIGAKGSLQIAAMTGNPGRGDIYTDESTAAVFAYNATAFATFTASEY